MMQDFLSFVVTLIDKRVKESYYRILRLINIQKSSACENRRTIANGS